VEEASHPRVGRFSVVYPARPLKRVNSVKLFTDNWVLMLSVGVTAKRDSVTPAPKPAMTFPGPDTLPFSSARKDLYVSNATNPVMFDQNIVNPTEQITHVCPPLQNFQ
jgi:hypothetical protein